MTDTIFWEVTVTVSPSRYSYADQVEKEYQIEAPIEFLGVTCVSPATLQYMLHAALSEYRDNAARKLQAEQLEKMQAEQEGEA